MIESTTSVLIGGSSNSFGLKIMIQ